MTSDNFSAFTPLSISLPDLAQMKQFHFLRIRSEEGPPNDSHLCPLPKSCGDVPSTLYLSDILLTISEHIIQEK